MDEDTKTNKDRQPTKNTNDTIPSRRNSQAPHPSATDNESWKTHPSEETNADGGANAELERKRKVEENAPGSRETRRGHAVADDTE
jgi:hypothetical protein